MPYPENFVVRLLICIVGLFVLWNGIHFLMDTFIHHTPFTIRIIDVVVPVGGGIAQALTWKPKK